MMVGSGAHSAPILVEPFSLKPSRSGAKVIGPASSARRPWRANTGSSKSVARL